MIVLLDSGVLGVVCNPNPSQEVINCKEWMYNLLAKGVSIKTSVICDYEVRRSLILASQTSPNINGIENLEGLQNIIDFLDIDKEIFNIAAQLWAKARLENRPTSNSKNIDVDMIISAHWQVLKNKSPGRYVVVATTNIRHLRQFTEAHNWQDIKF